MNDYCNSHVANRSDEELHARLRALSDRPLTPGLAREKERVEAELARRQLLDDYEPRAFDPEVG